MIQVYLFLLTLYISQLAIYIEPKWQVRACKLNVNRQTAKCKVLLKSIDKHGRLQELTDMSGSTQEL